jgi:hypothetical protein
MRNVILSTRDGLPDIDIEVETSQLPEWAQAAPIDSNREMYDEPRTK